MVEQTVAQGLLAAQAREERPLALRLSEALRRGVDFIGGWGSWLVIPLVVITGIDVIARKLVWVMPRAALPACRSGSPAM